VLAIGLDGYEPSVGKALMAEGRLPNLRRFTKQSAEFALDHGSAKRTGLAWEHVSLGKNPAAYGRHAAVSFNPESYTVTQFGTESKPFLADLDVRAVVFDAPYFDLQSAPNCQGLVGWGAHDAGVAAHSTPAGLAEEMAARFGPYPATPYIYGFVWPNENNAHSMANALVRATQLRGEISLWLLTERLPEWDLGLLVFSEFHSAIEAMWHGYDATHPLHHLPSAGAARDGIVGVYEAFDEWLGNCRTALPDVELVLFSMHGMGANDSDVATMLLLPELLYRRSFGGRVFEPREDWKQAVEAGELPMLADHESWSRAVKECMGETGTEAAPAKLDWMPASLYRLNWPRMEAFALPSYYDGRIRINLRGRERDGLVHLADYHAKLDELCALLHEIRNPRKGGTVIRSIERPVADDPLNADATQADLVIIWQGAPLALHHDSIGTIGPAPYRRTGGHSGRYGIAWFSSPEVQRDASQPASAFDVMPTVIDLLGRTIPPGVSGRSLLAPAMAPKARSA
jgi:predicted AlkP superfamily phosphohydrolase/phosphomutase